MTIVNEPLFEPARAPRRRLRAFTVVGGRICSIPVAEAGERIRAILAAPVPPPVAPVAPAPPVGPAHPVPPPVPPGQAPPANGGTAALTPPATEAGQPAAATPAAPPIWVDMVGPEAEEGEFLRSVGVHQLAIEDSLRGRQRPKVDRFPAHILMVSYAAHINRERNRVAFTELHLIMGAGFIITVRDHHIPEVRRVLARWRAAPDYFRDVGQLAHALLDSIIDAYFPIVEHFSERVAELETRIVEQEPGRAIMQDIIALRRELVLFRRVVGPQRDMLGDVLRRDLPFINPELVPFFMDVRDHTMRIAEELDVLRELLAATFDGQLSFASNQLNVTVRMMTAWSIILMSMAVVAGVYGMNFRNMPEITWRFGYLFALVLMLGVGLGIFAFFRRRGWI